MAIAIVLLLLAGAAAGVIEYKQVGGMGECAVEGIATLQNWGSVLQATHQDCASTCTSTEHCLAYSYWRGARLCYECTTAYRLPNYCRTYTGWSDDNQCRLYVTNVLPAPVDINYPNHHKFELQVGIPLGIQDALTVKWNNTVEDFNDPVVDGRADIVSRTCTLKENPEVEPTCQTLRTKCAQAVCSAEKGLALKPDGGLIPCSKSDTCSAEKCCDYRPECPWARTLGYCGVPDGALIKVTERVDGTNEYACLRAWQVYKLFWTPLEKNAPCVNVSFAGPLLSIDGLCMQGQASIASNCSTDIPPVYVNRVNQSDAIAIRVVSEGNGCLGMNATASLDALFDDEFCNEGSPYLVHASTAQTCPPGQARGPTGCAACTHGKFSNSYDADEECEEATACPLGEHVIDNATATHGNICATHGDCLASQYQVAPPTQYTDRQCEQRKNCSATQYAEPRVDTRDTECATVTDCVAGQYVAANPTETSDRNCTVCAAGQYSNTTNAPACINKTTACLADHRVEVTSAGSDNTCVACGTNTFRPQLAHPSYCVPLNWTGAQRCASAAVRTSVKFTDGADFVKEACMQFCRTNASALPPSVCCGAHMHVPGTGAGTNYYCTVHATTTIITSLVYTDHAVRMDLRPSPPTPAPAVQQFTPNTTCTPSAVEDETVRAQDTTSQCADYCTTERAKFADPHDMCCVLNGTDCTAVFYGWQETGPRLTGTDDPGSRAFYVGDPPPPPGNTPAPTPPPAANTSSNATGPNGSDDDDTTGGVAAGFAAGALLVCACFAYAAVGKTHTYVTDEPLLENI